MVPSFCSSQLYYWGRTRLPTLVSEVSSNQGVSCPTPPLCGGRSLWFQISLRDCNWKPWSISTGNPGTSAPGILGPDLWVERTLWIQALCGLCSENLGLGPESPQKVWNHSDTLLASLISKIFKVLWSWDIRTLWCLTSRKHFQK